MQRLIESLPAALVALLPALADAGLKGIVLLGAICLTMLPLRRASADARHLAWLCGIIGLLILPVFSTLLPDWRALPAWAVVPWPNAHPATPLPVAVLPLPLALTPGTTDAKLQVPPPRALAALAPAAPAVPSNSRHREDAAAVPPAGSWLVLAWVLGAVLFGTRLLLGHWRLHLASRRASPVTNGPLIDALGAAASALRLRRRVRLLLDPRRTIPLAWGVWQPRLILPAEAATWDSERCRAVLLHELAHVKRGDLLVLLLTQVACMLHWFNPLVWLAAWRLHIERERACDDLVLAAGVKASAYAEHLLHVATQLEACAPIGSLAMARRSRLEGRLLAVLNGDINRCSPTTRVVALLLLGLTVLLIPLAMLRGAEEKKAAEAVQLDLTGTVPTSEELAKFAADTNPQKRSAKIDELLKRAHPGTARAADADLRADATRQSELAPQLELLNREIEVAGEQLKRVTKGYEAGLAPIDSVVQQQRELALLKVEQAKLENDLEALENAIREQIALVERLRADQEKRVEAGVETRDSILTLQRESLRLERELAATDAKRRAASHSAQDEKRKMEENRRSEDAQKAQLELESMLSRGLGHSHPAVKAMRDRLEQLAVSAKASAESAARSERRREIAISAPKPGIVHQVLVQEGARIKSGDRLLVFDDRQAKVKLETARAQLDAAKAALKLQEIAVQSANADLEHAKEMAAARLAPQAEAASKQRAYHAAQANLAKSTAEAAVVEQQLRQAEIELELLTILSPKDGTILRINILEGEHTSPANDPLVVIGD